MVNLRLIQNTTRNAVETFEPVIPERKKFTYRLSMSSIGKKCTRLLQYGFHNCYTRKPVEPRIRRLFTVGNMSEQIIIDMLAEIGVEITNQQDGIVGFAGHAYGYIDGIAHNVPEAPKTPHLAEFKTHKEKYFKILIKKGVRTGFPEHYAQCQRYMREKKLTRTLYVGYNKNDSDVYFERIEFNEPYADDLYRKEQHIIISSKLAERLDEKDSYHCTYCSARSICLSGAEIYHNCRNCALVEKGMKGVWECTHHMMELTRDQQNEGCASWRIDNMFVSDLR